MPTHPKGFFEGVRYVGRVRARRAVYQVYDAKDRYLLVWPSRRAPHSHFLLEVPRRYADDARRKFRARDATSSDVKKRLGGPPFRPLGALVALTARGDAKIKDTKGLRLVFHVAA